MEDLQEVAEAEVQKSKRELIRLLFATTVEQKTITIQECAQNSAQSSMGTEIDVSKKIKRVAKCAPFVMLQATVRNIIGKPRS